MAEQKNTAVIPYKEQVDIALRKEKDVIAALLMGSPVKPDKLMASVLVEVDKIPALEKCSVKSVIGSAVEIARMGLEIGGTLGDAFILPYGKKAIPVVGYKGLVNLVMRSGLVKHVDAQAVYENDLFDYELGTDPWVKFRPNLKSRGELLCFYAAAVLASGGKVVEVMTLEQVNSIRDKSSGYQYAKANGITDNPWMTNYAEMGRKTAIRRITKRVPKGAIPLNRAMELEEAMERGEAVDMEAAFDAAAQNAAQGTVTVIRPDGSTVNTETGEITRTEQASGQQATVPNEDLTRAIEWRDALYRVADELHVSREDARAAIEKTGLSVATLIKWTSADFDKAEQAVRAAAGVSF